MVIMLSEEIFLLLLSVSVEAFELGHQHLEIKRIYRMPMSPAVCEDLCRYQIDPECGRVRVERNLCILMSKEPPAYPDGPVCIKTDYDLKYQSWKARCPACNTDVACPASYSNMYCCGSQTTEGKHVPSCYKLLRGKMPWGKARRECKRHLGRLVSIETQGENDFIASIILARISGRSLVWTSGSDVENEGTWIWTATQQTIKLCGEWAEDNPAPDLVTAMKEDYLGLIRSSTNETEWQDFPGNHPKRALCEISAGQ